VSLLLGIVAALCWGIHDLIVRLVSQRMASGPMMVFALGSGVVMLLPLAMIEGWGAMSPRAWALALAAGVALPVALLGLYRSLQIGPVSLVAPVCGAFPLGALVLAQIGGRAPSWGEWLAVAVILGGITLVARAPGQAQGSRLQAVAWAALAACGFALTFHLSQLAAQLGGTFPVSLVGRVAALGLVLGALALRGQGLRPAQGAWRPLLAMGALDVVALAAVTLAGHYPHPEHASVATAAFGVVTILLAWRVLGERLGPVQGVGVALAFGGIALLAAGS